MIFQDLLQCKLLDKDDKKQGGFVLWIQLFDSHERVIEKLNFDSDQIQNAETWRFDIVEEMGNFLFKRKYLFFMLSPDFFSNWI